MTTRNRVQNKSNPVVRELRGDEATSLLGRNWIGRIAFAHHDRVDIEPIHYVFDAPWIFGRTAAGTKLLTLSHNQWCALEVDEVHGMFDWASVVVKGPFTSEDGNSGGWDRARAIAAIQRLVPEALTDADPSPNRNVVFGIYVSEISGRSSTSWHTKPPLAGTVEKGRVALDPVRIPALVASVDPTSDAIMHRDTLL